jgi:transcriptional regulator with XRE-family HTH domain
MNGIEIKVARIRAGLHQYEVAARVGICPSKLSEIESRRRQPNPELLNHILAVIREADDAKKR